MKTNILLTVSFLVIILLSSCGSAKDAVPVTSINIEMSDFAFTPMSFTIAAGQQITITAVNNGVAQHEFIIMKKGTAFTPPFSEDDTPNVYFELEVENGKTQIVTFTAPNEPGDYQFLCGLNGHAEAGMVGTITVK